MADQIDELLGAATRALRDLDRRALLDLAQHERDPLIVGQRVERQRQAVGQLPPLGHRVGRRRLSAAHPLDLGQALRRPPTPRRRAHVAPRAPRRVSRSRSAPPVTRTLSATTGAATEAGASSATAGATTATEATSAPASAAHERSSER